jgi:hypothetical protein
MKRTLVFVESLFQAHDHGIDMTQIKTNMSKI